MGLATATWRFATRPPPDIDAVRMALAEATGLAVTRDRDGGVLELPDIQELVMGWDYEEDRLTLHVCLPPHPYLSAALDAVMASFGGALVEGDPVEAGLQRRWQALSPRDRWLLRRRPLWAWRPLDRFLSTRRAGKPD